MSRFYRQDASRAFDKRFLEKQHSMQRARRQMRVVWWVIAVVLVLLYGWLAAFLGPRVF